MSSKGNLRYLYFTAIGPDWFSMYYDPAGDTKAFVFTIANTTVPLDVYVCKGWTSDPNSYEFCAKFIGVKDIF